MSATRFSFRMYALLTALLCVLCLGSACHRGAGSPYELLLAMQAAEAPLPSGKLYLRSAPEGDPSHLSDPLLAALFGNGALPPAMDGVEDAACFFSYTHPCEFSVFLCKTLSSTSAVSQMCLRRLDAIRQHRSYDGLDDAAVSDYLDRASVTVRGRYVILCVSSDPDAAFRAIRRIG